MRVRHLQSYLQDQGLIMQSSNLGLDNFNQDGTETDASKDNENTGNGTTNEGGSSSSTAGPGANKSETGAAADGTKKSDGQTGHDSLYSYLSSIGSALASNTSAHQLKKLRGMRIGIDAVFWLRSVHALKDPLADGIGGTPPGIYGFVDKELDAFKRWNITPVFVFQGI